MYFVSLHGHETSCPVVDQGAEKRERQGDPGKQEAIAVVARTPRPVLGEEDQVVLVGQKASWMASSILENGARPDQVIVLECPEDCRSLVEDFEGNIFLKGSRKYKLEEIIPQWAVEQTEPMESALC